MPTDAENIAVARKAICGADTGYPNTQWDNLKNTCEELRNGLDNPPNPTKGSSSPGPYWSITKKSDDVAQQLTARWSAFGTNLNIQELIGYANELVALYDLTTPVEPDPNPESVGVGNTVIGSQNNTAHGDNWSGPNPLPTPTTYSRTDLVDAVNRSANTGLLTLNPGTYVNDGGQITLPPGVQTDTYGRVTIRGEGFKVADGCDLHSLDFIDTDASGERFAVMSGTASESDGAIIRDCTFTGYNRAIVLEQVECHNWKIVDNTFDECNVSVHSILSDSVEIGRNVMHTSSDSAAEVLFYGGHDAWIHHNDINRGVTGILFLAFPGISGARGQFFNNLVEYNTVYGCSEEHISLDCHGNDPSNTAAFDKSSVSSNTATSVTLPSSFSTSGNRFVGYHMMFNSGALAGKHGKITSHSGTTFNLDIDTSSVRAGDLVVIGAVLANNTIRHNLADGTSRGRTETLSVYGLCYNNTIEHNTVYGHDLIVTSLNSLVSSSRSVTRSPCKAPSESNKIIDNTVGKGANLVWKYLDFGSSTKFNSHGNVESGTVYQDGARFVRDPSFV